MSYICSNSPCSTKGYTIRDNLSSHELLSIFNETQQCTITEKQHLGQCCYTKGKTKGIELYVQYVPLKHYVNILQLKSLDEKHYFTSYH